MSRWPLRRRIRRFVAACVLCARVPQVCVRAVGSQSVRQVVCVPPLALDVPACHPLPHDQFCPAVRPAQSHPVAFPLPSPCSHFISSVFIADDHFTLACSTCLRVRARVLDDRPTLRIQTAHRFSASIFSQAPSASCVWSQGRFEIAYARTSLHRPSDTENRQQHRRTPRQRQPGAASS